jgi:hypothetical protein
MQELDQETDDNDISKSSSIVFAWKPQDIEKVRRESRAPNFTYHPFFSHS